MPLDPALPFEGWRHDIYTEVRLAAGPVSGMALMQMRFVFDLEAFRRESFAQLIYDSVPGVHGGKYAPVAAYRQWRFAGQELFAMSRLEASAIA
jgi:hypothetical protein